jgi:hypothetical protein
MNSRSQKHSPGEVVTTVVNVVLLLYFMTSEGTAIWLIHAGRAEALASNEPRLVAAFVAFLVLLVASIAGFLISSPIRKWLKRLQAVILLLLATAIAFAEIRLAWVGQQGVENYSITLGFGAALLGYCIYFAQRAFGLGASGRFVLRNFYLWPGVTLFLIEIAAIVRLR